MKRFQQNLRSEPASVIESNITEWCMANETIYLQAYAITQQTNKHIISTV